MVHVFNGWIKLIGVVLELATVRGSAIRQDPQQADLVLGEEGDHVVVQQVGSRDSRLLGVSDVSANGTV